jgi:hypothetical protein
MVAVQRIARTFILIKTPLENCNILTNRPLLETFVRNFSEKSNRRHEGPRKSRNSRFFSVPAGSTCRVSIKLRRRCDAHLALESGLRQGGNPRGKRFSPKTVIWKKRSGNDGREIFREHLAFWCKSLQSEECLQIQKHLLQIVSDARLSSSLRHLRSCGFRFCLLGSRFPDHSFGKFLGSCFTVPLFVCLVGDLSFDEKLSEFASLGFALEWHNAEYAVRNFTSAR